MSTGRPEQKVYVYVPFSFPVQGSRTEPFSFPHRALGGGGVKLNCESQGWGDSRELLARYENSFSLCESIRANRLRIAGPSKVQSIKARTATRNSGHRAQTSSPGPDSWLGLSSSGKRKHRHAKSALEKQAFCQDMLRGRPRKNCSLKNLGLIFHSLNTGDLHGQPIRLMSVSMTLLLIKAQTSSEGVWPGPVTRL